MDGSNPRPRWLASLLCAWLVILIPNRSQAAFYLESWENHREPARTLSLTPSVSRYFSDTNYDYQSKLMIPTGMSGGYQRVQTDLSIAYGIHERLTVYGRFGWEWMSLSHETRSGSAYGLADQTLGLNFRTWSNKQGFAIDLQAQGEIPLYSNTTAKANNLLFLGDGSYDVGGGLFITVPAYNGRSYRLRALAGTGYVWRSALFSSHIPYSFQLALAPLQDGVFFSTGIRGLQSLKTDASGNSGIDSTGSQASSGGSFVVNAINPSLLSWAADAGYRFNPRLALGLRFDKSIWGQRAPDGWQLGAFLTGSWGFQAAETTTVNTKAEDYAGANQGFVTYSMDAFVTDASERLNKIRIDKGGNDGVEVGQLFDIFVFKDGNLGEAVARAKITAVNASDSELSVVEYYKEVWIDRGFIAKRPVLAPK